MKKKVYENRELSWLKFNERVLKEAKREDVPLCERLSFVSIYQTNLDEFFMVRVGSLYDQVTLRDDYKDDKSHMTSIEQIDAICEKVRKLNQKKEKIYAVLIEELREQGINIIDPAETTGKEEQHLASLFKKAILPFVSPIVIGKQQTFPFLKNCEMYVTAVLKTRSNNEKTGIVACENDNYPRLIPVPKRKGSYVLAEDMIKYFLPLLFPNYRVKEGSVLRVTRNADIGMERYYDEDLDYRAEMENIIKMRRKLSPVRIEMTEELAKEHTDKICQFLLLENNKIFYNSTPLDFGFFWDIRKILKDKTELFYPKVPKLPDVSGGMIDRVRQGDVLLTYPFETMQPFLELLREAAESEETESISITLYRVASKSEVVTNLIRAAQNGKKVNVLVELKARFDEENNIEWSKRLEDSGCNVIYGWSGLKVHSKLCLIKMKREDKTSYISQIGTGNYNEKTADLYTDLSLMTASDEIGREAEMIFEKLFSGELVEDTTHLLVAPNCMKDNILMYIDEEIERAEKGENAYIGAKINSLTDIKIIKRLIKASQAGVRIELIVRGICCLNPQIEGYTDNIRIISIVGQYLEHSRIFLFGTEERQKMFIASADWMSRNMSKRVEVGAPVYDEDIKLRIRTMFELMLADSEKAREKYADSKYRRVKRDYSLCSQEYLAREYGLNTPERLQKAINLLEELKSE